MPFDTFLFLYLLWHHQKEISFFKLLIKIVLCLFLYLIKIEFSPTGQFVFSTIIKYNSFLLYLCIEIPPLFNELIKLLNIIIDKLNRGIAVKIFPAKKISSTLSRMVSAFYCLFRLLSRRCHNLIF